MRRKKTKREADCHSDIHEDIIVWERRDRKGNSKIFFLMILKCTSPEVLMTCAFRANGSA